MSFRVLLMTTLSFALMRPAFAAGAESEKKCIKSATEFNQQSADLPAPFNKLPLFLALDFPKAAIQVRLAGEKLKLITFTPGLFSGTLEEGYIKEVCFLGSKIDVIMESDPKSRRDDNETHTVVVEKGIVKVDNHAFSKCSKAQFDQIAGIGGESAKASTHTQSAGDGVN